LRALRLFERREQRRRQLVAAAIEQPPLRQAGTREARDPDAAIGGARRDPHQAVVLQGAQQAADITRVELEAASQLAHLAAIRSDLPEEARLAERPVAGEEAVAERAHALCDHAVEAPDVGDLRAVEHSLTLVSKPPAWQPRSPDP